MQIDGCAAHLNTSDTLLSWLQLFLTQMHVLCLWVWPAYTSGFLHMFRFACVLRIRILPNDVTVRYTHPFAKVTTPWRWAIHI